MIEIFYTLPHIVLDAVNHVIAGDYIWFVLVAVSFYVGMTKGGIGNGLGSLSIIFLTLTIDPLLALGITLTIFWTADFIGFISWWGKWQKDHAVRGVLLCIIGVILGYFLLLPIQRGYISTDLLKNLLGLLGLGLTLRWWITTQVQKQDLIKYPPIVNNTFAVISGFASTTLSFGGIFMMSYALNLSLKASTMHATTVFMSFSINSIKLIPYSMLGLFNKYIFIVSLSLVPFVLAGVWFGKYIHNRMNHDLFIKIAYGGVAIASVKILFDVWVQ